MVELWNELARRANVALSDAQHVRLARYLELLLEANRTMNLTRITDPVAAQIQHVGDAMTLLPHLPAGPFALADVGSGGGVPGIPLAVARPDATVTLIESTGKKAKFLQQTVEAMELANVRIVNSRAEEAGRGKLRESFDIAAARAVGRLVWLAEWCLPLVKKGGQMLAMKGERVEAELPEAATAIRRLGGGAPRVHPVELPGAEHHVIVQIAKVGRTDPRWPRLPSVAKDRPM